MKLILLGAPGAGKGTQAEVLSKRLNIPTVSTGNILRAAVKAGTPMGLTVKTRMDTGKLVPDDVIIGIIAERVKEKDCANGYILDGAPRTIAQAEAMEAAGIYFDDVISIEISDGEIEQRMTGRRTCTHCGTTFHVIANPPKRENICDVCGGELILRVDDTLETVRNRLEIYHRETEPLKGFYESRGVLRVVHNQPTIDATSRVVLQTLGL